MSLKNRLNRQSNVVDLTQRRLERDLMNAYADSLKTVQAKVADFWRKYSDDAGKMTMAEVSRYNRLANLEKDIVKEMGKLSSKQNLTTTKTIKNVYEESFYRTAFVVDNEVRRQFEARLQFSQLPTKQVEAAVLNPYDRITWPERSKRGIQQATRRVKEEVTRGIIQGKGYVETSRSLKDVYDKTASEALRIVQTESHRAREAGRWDAFQDAEEQGLLLRYYWVSSLDDRTRDMHADMDGREAEEAVDPKDGEEKVTFVLPDGAVGVPGNTGEAHHDINCRCGTRSEMADFKPEVRRERLSDAEYERRKAEEQAAAKAAGRDPQPIPRGEIKPYRSYHEWAHDNGIE